MKIKDHKIHLLVALFIVLAVVIVLSAKVDAMAINAPLGGRVIAKPALIVTASKLQCTTLATCGGNAGVTWADLTSATCSGGTFSLMPNYPKSSSATDYCVNAGADNKTNTTITVMQWILGLFTPSTTTPTIIGTCTCLNGVYPAIVTTVVTVQPNMAHVTMFGTSKY